MSGFPINIFYLTRPITKLCVLVYVDGSRRTKVPSFRIRESTTFKEQVLDSFNEEGQIVMGKSKLILPAELVFVSQEFLVM